MTQRVERRAGGQGDAEDAIEVRCAGVSERGRAGGMNGRVRRGRCEGARRGGCRVRFAGEVGRTMRKREIPKDTVSASLRPETAHSMVGVSWARTLEVLQQVCDGFALVVEQEGLVRG